MFHNDEVEVRVRSNPVGFDGKRMPPGHYEVWIGLVQEFITWFYDKGDSVLKLTVEVRQSSKWFPDTRRSSSGYSVCTGSTPHDRVYGVSDY